MPKPLHFGWFLGRGTDESSVNSVTQQLVPVLKERGPVRDELLDGGILANLTRSEPRAGEGSGAAPARPHPV